MEVITQGAEHFIYKLAMSAMHELWRIPNSDLELKYRLLWFLLHQEVAMRLFPFRRSSLVSFCIIFSPLGAIANTYIKTYNQYMGTASTGESVTLISVKTQIRGGYGSWVIYKIGKDIVETGIVCPAEYAPRGYFTDQGTRYPQSAATRKVLAIACAYENSIVNTR